VTGPHLVLIGMMGAGKSTVGRRLARRLHRPFLDSDELIKAETGRTVAEIFRADGEPAFRRIESRVVTEMLDDPVPAVIAAAGGSVLDPTSRARMRDRGIVVWLQVGPATLSRRVRGSTHRPLLDVDPEGTLARLAGERESLYRETAHQIVDVGTKSPDEVVDEVLERTGASA
jgi:shikimate kinase